MTDKQKQNAIAYIGKGYSVVSIPPPAGIKVEVITEDLEIHTNTFDDFDVAVRLYIVNNKNVLAWKHIQKI